MIIRAASWPKARVSLVPLIALPLWSAGACGDSDDQALFTNPDSDAAVEAGGGAAGTPDASQAGGPSDASQQDAAPGDAHDAQPDGAAGAPADGGSGLCDVCDGNSFIPCTDAGTPAPPVDCLGQCVPGTGCVACLPGQRSCSGNDVVECDASGQGTTHVESCQAPEECLAGDCVTPCAAAAAHPSNVGCEFWAVDLDQVDHGADPASAPFGVWLANPGAKAATVTVERNEAPPGSPPAPQIVTTLQVPAGAAVSVTLPMREVDCGIKPNDYAAPGTCLSSRAYRLSSTVPLAAFQLNALAASSSNDASMLLPTHALGFSYRAIGWSAGHPIPITTLGIVDRSYVTVVGVAPNTLVTVTPGWRIKGNPPVNATPTGGKIAVTLGAFDVLNLETDDGTFNDDTNTLSDLSGTVVEASGPVAVFAGAESTAAPGPFDVPTYPGWSDTDTCCLDHLEEQLLPNSLLGLHYIATRSPVRSTSSFREPDILRFVGGDKPASVTTNLPAPFDSFSLQPGEVKTTWAQNNAVISATQPVIVGQLLVSGQYADPALGDPSLLQFPPVERFRTDYVIATPSTYAKDWVVLAAEVGTSVTLDGAGTASCAIEPAGQVAGKSYESRRCPVTPGVHHLSGQAPFGVLVYGYASAASYACAGGLGN